MDYSILIRVDINDADYIMDVNKISEEDLEKIKPLIEAIKNFKPYMSKDSDGKEWKHYSNYPIKFVRDDLGEKNPKELYPEFSDEVHEILSDLCPYGDDGFHTIEEISIAPYIERTRLL